MMMMMMMMIFYSPCFGRYYRILTGGALHIPKPPLQALNDFTAP
jgi:hypothetical protein